jgi:hypothetical protein
MLGFVESEDDAGDHELISWTISGFSPRPKIQA